MRSTKPLPSLQISFRRADVAAFWMLTTVVIASLMAFAAAASGAQAPSVWGAAALVLLVPGLVWRPWFRLGVRAWNKGARVCSIALRAYVLKVCYYVFFRGVSASGSSALDLGLGSTEVSRWIPKAGHGSDASRTGADRDQGQGLLDAARRPGSTWMIALFPVVLLLRILWDDEQDSSPSSSTYTLY